MKSIIEQASSIVKAIEKAWNQAEQPKEFSIKIFEKEERNFFGMTTKPAKIGIFFGDKPIIHDKPAQRPRPEIKECRSSTPTPKPSSAKSFGEHGKAPADKPITNPTPKQPIKPEQQQTTQPAVQTKPVQPRPQPNITEKKQPIASQQPETQANAIKEKPKRAPATWNDAMVASAHGWLNKTLSLMDRGSISFSSEIAGKNLKLTFSMPLIADVTHEKQLFRSFAHLIMSSLRNQYKQEIRDLKVILIRPE